MNSGPLVKGVKGLVKGLVKGFAPKNPTKSTMVKGVKGWTPDYPMRMCACGRARGRAGARAHARIPRHKPFTPFTPLTKWRNAMKEGKKFGEGFGEGCEGLWR